MRRTHPDDAAVLPRPADLGPLFDWPQAPPVTGDEQVFLGDERWARWSETADGARVLAWIEREAMARLHAGERRIGMKALAEACRDALHIPVNNSATSWLARWLVGRHPTLRGTIQLRKRQ